MTKETYKRTITEIDAKIKKLYEEKAAARTEFLQKNAELKVGDKVKVYQTEWRSRTEVLVAEVFISGVNDKYFSGDVNYQFVKVKKDGTPSNVNAGVYSFSRLEKSEQ